MKIDIPRLVLRWLLKNKEALRGKIDVAGVKNILVMSNTAIGDTLFATPALRLIKETYPHVRITALLNPNNYQLFETNPFIDNVITYKNKWRGFLKIVNKLKKTNIDLTFILHSNEPQATPLAYFIGSKYIIKIPNDTNEFRHLHYNAPTSRVPGEYTIENQLKQLKYIDINKANFNMELFPDKSWYRDVDKVLMGDTVYVGFQLGATTRNRMWFEENWSELASMVLEYKDNINIVLTGSPSEVRLTDSLEKTIGSSRVLNLAGKFDLCGAAALIDRLSVLITPDTGPLHIAAALKTPTITISVTGEESSSKPRDATVNHQYIQKPKTCDPCLDKHCTYQKCMWQITPEEVFETLKKVV
jgi:ADP-heptose:LPS heptosyltransferase